MPEIKTCEEYVLQTLADREATIASQEKKIESLEEDVKTLTHDLLEIKKHFTVRGKTNTRIIFIKDPSSEYSYNEETLAWNDIDKDKFDELIKVFQLKDELDALLEGDNGTNV